MAPNSNLAQRGPTVLDANTALQAFEKKKKSERAKANKKSKPEKEPVMTEAEMEEIMQVMKAFVKNQADARATIRRKRIQQYYKDKKYDFDYEPYEDDEDEQESLQKLKEAEYAAGLIFSDDEEDQAEKSASEEEDDEDQMEVDASSGDSDDDDDDSDW